MGDSLSLIKGIHPGLILEWELKKRKLAKGKFALSINEFPQTLVSIIKGNRRMNPSLSLKIEKALGFEEGYFMVLQVFYDIELVKRKQAEGYHPDLSKIRTVVFWDTDINLIDWNKNRTAIIHRIFERGNEQEINMIIAFYGREAVLSILGDSENLLDVVVQNRIKYLYAS
jgi:plasmid maintenance system antidote protein VapI